MNDDDKARMVDLLGLTPDEEENLRVLSARHRELATAKNLCEASQRDLFAQVFARVLRTGSWETIPRGSGADIRIRPANPVAENALTQFGQLTILQGWHDSLCIEGGGEYLSVDFDDGVVIAEFATADPVDVKKWARALHVDLDVKGLRKRFAAEALAKIDAELAKLQEKRDALVAESKDEDDADSW